jgi:hypothetical protein
MRIVYFLAAAAAVGGIAAPLAAQSPYQYPQTYPPQYQQQYPQPYPGQPGYGYNNQGTVGSIINQLLGNRYNVTDRTAVSQCATAAMAEASNQYRPNGYNGYGQGGYGQQGYPQQYGNNYANMMRVTAITDVHRRSNGLRVSGLLSSGYGGYGQQGYGQGGYGQQGYADPRYASRGDLSFRCNVDYRGAVTNVRIRRNDTAWRAR